MSKRRIFDIDFPDEPQPVPAGTATSDKDEDARRGPMATAISENAGALKERAEAEAQIRAENDRLAHEHVRLKKLGLITDLIPIDAIHAEKLTRDRSTSVDPDLEELKQSIRDIGLSNPIRVEASGEGFELVQGFRRLSAFRALHAETGEERFAAIPATLMAAGETLEGLYRRMVDENLVRRDLSFAEMARLAMAYARDPETEARDVEQAVVQLYGSAGRQKRSYIRHFATVLEMIGEGLRFAEAMPRALGLQLEKRLSNVPEARAELLNALAGGDVRTPEEELEILRRHAAAGAGAVDAPKPAAKAASKTTLRCTVPAGTVRCVARNGKVEIGMERDFSGVDRHRLEAAVAAFMAALDNGEA